MPLYVFVGGVVVVVVVILFGLLSAGRFTFHIHLLFVPRPLVHPRAHALSSDLAIFDIQTQEYTG